MNQKKIILLIIIVIISVFLWGFCLNKGWLKEAYLFGNNVYESMFDKIFKREMLSIPEDENITTVQYGKFAYKLLTDIIIPGNITTIEDSAFIGNRLTSITIGKDVSLGKKPFGSGFETAYNNNNKEAGTFTRTDHKAKEWTVWHDNFSFINDNENITITGFKGTGAAIIPDKIYGNPVTVIANNAFRNKELTDIIIPNGVITIGNNAFDENKLTRVIIPNSVITIGSEAFCCNQLSNLTIGNRVTTIGNGAFGAGSKGKGLLTSIYTPNSTVDIGMNAFNGHPIIRVSIGANAALGSGNDGQSGILGQGTGFNTAYSNNNKRSGIYTRPNAQSGQWSRSAR